MKKHLPSAAVLAALLLVLCLHAFAAEHTSFDSGLSTSASSGGGYIFTKVQETKYTDYTDVIPVLTAAETNGNLRTAPDITVNGTSIGHLTARTLVGSTTYAEAGPILQVLYPEIALTTQDGHLTATFTSPMGSSSRRRRSFFPLTSWPKLWAVPSRAAAKETTSSSSRWNLPSRPIHTMRMTSTGSPTPSLPSLATNP